MPEIYTDPAFEVRLGQKIADLGERYVRPVDAVRISNAAAAGQVRRQQSLGSGALGQRAFVDRRLVWLLVAAAVALGLAVAGVASRPVAGRPYELAFVRDGDLYLAAHDGSGPAMVDVGMRALGGGFRQLAWSPDGSQLAYVHNVGANVELKVIERDGTSRFTYRSETDPRDQVEPDPSETLGFAWGPEQQLAVYSVADPEHLALLGPAGDRVGSIALPDGFMVSGAEDTVLSWSPDGRWIAVGGCPAQRRPCGHAAKAIVMLAADGTGWHWLSDENADQQWLAWGPGSQVAVASYGAQIGTAFGVSDRSGIRIVDLPDGRWPGPNAWRPDGSEVASMAFGGDVDAGQTIVVTRPDGTVTPVAMDPYEVIYDVEWSADGEEILFAGAPSGEDHWSLWSISPEGGAPRLIAEDAAPFAISPTTSTAVHPSAEASLLTYLRDGTLVLEDADASHRSEVGDMVSTPTDSSIVAVAPDLRHVAARTASGVAIVSRTSPGAAPAMVDVPSGETMEFGWDPTGQQLAVFSDADPHHISVVATDGSRTGSIKLPSGFRQEQMGRFGLSWSPDGAWIALEGCDQTCSGGTFARVMLVATDGSGSRWLTDQTPRLSDPPLGGSETSIAWNPDGRVAVGIYCQDQDPWCTAPVASRVEVYDAAGKRLQRYVVPDGLIPDALAWSNDGSRLAVAAWLGGPGAAERPSRLFTLADDGSATDVRTGLKPPTAVTRIRWEPGDQRLWLQGSDELVVIDLRASTQSVAATDIVGFDLDGGPDPGP